MRKRYKFERRAACATTLGGWMSGDLYLCPEAVREVFGEFEGALVVEVCDEGGDDWQHAEMCLDYDDDGDLDTTWVSVDGVSEYTLDADVAEELAHHFGSEFWFRRIK